MGELPALDDFLRTIGASQNKATALLRVLCSRLDPDAPLAKQLVAIEHLGRFVVAGPSIPGISGQAIARLELLVVALERVPEAREKFVGTIRSIAWQTHAIKLFGEVGLPNDKGLWAETTDRLARRFLPEAPRPHELWMLASHVIRKESDLAWLGPAADPLLQRLAEIGGDAWAPLRASVLDAISLIAMRIAASGIAEAFRARGQLPDVRQSPFYQLSRAHPEDMASLIPAAREEVERIRHALEHTGVSIEVVYALDTIERGLARIELLLPFAGEPAFRPPYAIRSLIAATGNGIVGLRSFKQLMADNTRLLARKVVERAGHSGEHYVTSSRREYWTMFKSAVGGGAVIVFLTAGKFLIKWGHFAPFLDAVLASAAYSAAFLVMQFLGLTLATKQPSMTAAALAGSIRERSGPGQLDELVMTIARIARSQFAAIVGNVLAVIAVALAFDAVYTYATGEPFLDAHDAVATAKSLDPIGSWTIPLAAFTGVQLWMSSLVAGWFENWVVYRRIPDAIEHHRLGKRFGRARMVWAARFLERHAAGLGGSISLGLLFGFLPQFGAFFGISLDGRHITITTTSLVLSATSIGIDGLGTETFVRGVLGLVTVAICNFGVSFTLALLVALRAREVPHGGRAIPAAVIRRFFQHPLEFFFPPKGSQASAH